MLLICSYLHKQGCPPAESLRAEMHQLAEKNIFLISLKNSEVQLEERPLCVHAFALEVGVQTPFHCALPPFFPNKNTTHQSFEFC